VLRHSLQNQKPDQTRERVSARYCRTRSHSFSICTPQSGQSGGPSWSPGGDFHRMPTYWRFPCLPVPSTLGHPGGGLMGRPSEGELFII